MAKTPKIRFKNFSDEWVENKLGNISDITTGKLNANAMKEDGKYDFYTSGIQKYKIDIPAFEGPAITIAGNGATVGYMYLADGKFNAYQRTYVLLNFKENRIFLFFEIKNKLSKKIAQEARAGNIPYIVLDMLTNLEIFTPIAKEQQKIGAFFSKLDKLITLHQSKFEKLQKIKKSCLQNLFPQNNQNTPKIRFKNFNDEWVENKLGETVERYYDETAIPKNGYERLGIRSHGKGTFHTKILKGQELETGKMFRVKKDNLIVNITFAWEHAVAITDDLDDGKLVSHRFPQFSMKENMISKFLKYLILDKKFKYHLWLSSPGGAGRNRVLKIDAMLDYSLNIPKSTQEQEKIGAFFSKLDKLITLHQSKFKKLQKIKKSCLQNMFV